MIPRIAIEIITSIKVNPDCCLGLANSRVLRHIGNKLHKLTLSFLSPQNFQANPQETIRACRLDFLLPAVGAVFLSWEGSPGVRQSGNFISLRKPRYIFLGE